jgi:hypothetical protein
VAEVPELMLLNIGPPCLIDLGIRIHEAGRAEEPDGEETDAIILTLLNIRDAGGDELAEIHGRSRIGIRQLLIGLAIDAGKDEPRGQGARSGTGGADVEESGVIIQLIEAGRDLDPSDGTRDVEIQRDTAKLVLTIGLTGVEGGLGQLPADRSRRRWTARW